MPKHTNVVRFKVKAGKQAEFEEMFKSADKWDGMLMHCLLYTSPSPRDRTRSRMPSSA